MSVNTAPSPTPPFTEAATSELEKDPVFKLMEAYYRFLLVTEDCFQNNKTWLPLRMHMEEQSDGGVHFDISSDTIVNVQRLEENLPSYENISGGEKRLKCAYWEIAAEQSADERFVVTRTLHHHALKDMPVRGQLEKKTGIGYVSDEKSYTATFDDMLTEIKDTVFELLTPQHRTKLENFLKQQKANIFAAPANTPSPA